MRAIGQRLTSLVSVSLSHACGLTRLSLQVSISDAMIAQLAPPSSLPANNAFLRLCRALHKRNYAQVRIMRSCRCQQSRERSFAPVCAMAPFDNCT
jgi:hypothetical protein